MIIDSINYKLIFDNLKNQKGRWLLNMSISPLWNAVSLKNKINYFLFLLWSVLNTLILQSMKSFYYLLFFCKICQYGLIKLAKHWSDYLIQLKIGTSLNLFMIYKILLSCRMRREISFFFNFDNKFYWVHSYIHLYWFVDSILSNEW